MFVHHLIQAEGANNSVLTSVMMLHLSLGNLYFPICPICYTKWNAFESMAVLQRPNTGTGTKEQGLHDINGTFYTACLSIIIIILKVGRNYIPNRSLFSQLRCFPALVFGPLFPGDTMKPQTGLQYQDCNALQASKICFSVVLNEQNHTQYVNIISAGVVTFWPTVHMDIVSCYLPFVRSPALFVSLHMLGAKWRCFHCGIWPILAEVKLDRKLLFLPKRSISADKAVSSFEKVRTMKQMQRGNNKREREKED